jgi:hypothetical protein
MAQLGAEHAPVPAPSWLSMAPGSPFLGSLRQTPLPPETHYHLLFSYRGASKLIGESNDDIVGVSSELPLDLQRAATSVLGFDESHTGILRSAEVSRALNEILASIDATRALPPSCASTGAFEPRDRGAFPAARGARRGARRARADLRRLNAVSAAYTGPAARGVHHVAAYPRT